MIITYGRIFKKMFRKQTKFIQTKFEQRLLIFINQNNHPLLNIHSLDGEWSGCKSFNVTGDIRVVFEEINEDHIELIAIGSHSELYK